VVEFPRVEWSLLIVSQPMSGALGETLQIPHWIIDSLASPSRSHTATLLRCTANGLIHGNPYSCSILARANATSKRSSFSLESVIEQTSRSSEKRDQCYILGIKYYRASEIIAKEVTTSKALVCFYSLLRTR